MSPQFVSSLSLCCSKYSAPHEETKMHTSEDCVISHSQGTS